MNKQKNSWTEEEDAAITMLYQQRHIEDWSEIGRILYQEYNFQKKNSKLYKDRYLNQLSNPVFKIEWSEDEQKLFMKLHNQIGNKWASIAQQLIGKTDNCVKNHFYSKLRKLLRKLNKIIQFFLKKQFRPIDISIMYKIVEAAQQRFKQKPNCEHNVSIECLGVQNQMLEFAMQNEENDGTQDQQLKYSQSKIQQYRQLIKQIYRVSKLYKRKSKKVRNSLIQAPINSNKKKNKKGSVKVQQHEVEQKEIYNKRQKNGGKSIRNKNSSTNLSDDEEVKQQQQEENYEQQIEPQQVIKKGKRNQHNSRIQVQEGEGIQQILRTAGILHDQIKMSVSKKQKNSRKYSNSQYSSGNPILSSPSMNCQQPLNFINGNLNADYSPLHSFSSQQVQNFLGFPMVNNPNGNGYANFTLSQKSSFKSYSQIDPSQIQNPFFDEYSSNNGRFVFPMNFSGTSGNQYNQQPYDQNQQFGTPSYQSNTAFSNFPYQGGVYYPSYTQEAQVDNQDNPEYLDTEKKE